MRPLPLPRVRVAAKAAVVAGVGATDEDFGDASSAGAASDRRGSRCQCNNYEDGEGVEGNDK